jgi:hypothetical protein
MPDWSLVLLGVVLGYVLRESTAELFEARRQQRTRAHQDMQVQREGLLHLLGELRAHFEWLREAAAHPITEEAEDRAKTIREWILSHEPRYPSGVERAMTLIANVSGQLGRGDRHFMDRESGEESIDAAWKLIEEHEQKLKHALHGPWASRF